MNWHAELLTADRGEGCTSAMRSAGTSLPWPYLLKIPSDVKQHGTQPQMRNSAHVELKPNRKIVKRSLQRAQRRAQAHGMTWYRGQCLTSQDFLRMGMPPLSDPAPIQQPAAIETCHRHNTPKKRLVCMTWNGGGLASHRLDEVKQWLHVQKIHIAVLSETRWTFQATWSDNAWHHIHSADPAQRGSGVLILIAKSLCSAENLRWNEVVPGRLLHVRLLMPARNIDILGCYQYVFSKDHACKQNRENFWKALDHQLSQMPARNTLAVMGDMNCSLFESHGVCGTTCFRWQDALHQGPAHADGGRFLSILKLHGLVALNTWNSSLGPTFNQHGHASRIDYICTRQQFADGGAKSLQIIWQAPFMPLTRAGHAPIVGHLPLYWIPTVQQKAGLTPHQRKQGRQAMMDRSETWNMFRQEAMASIWHHMEHVLTSGHQDLDTVHEIVLKQFSAHFPAASSQQRFMPWQSNPVVHSKWQHRSMYMAVNSMTLGGMFQAWYHWTKFHVLNRLQRKFARNLRRRQFEETVAMAQQAANRHDTHQLFEIINRFAPKTPRRSMQLRSEQGALMTPHEERKMLIDFVSETWRGVPLTPLHTDRPLAVPFTIDALAAALSRIPTAKAAAPPCAPGMIWNSLADQLAPILHALLTKWWSQSTPWIPMSWRSGWLQLIPKPNKPPVRPHNLRPLALQCPLGKAVMGLLIQLASQQADSEFRRWPLWAFLAHRSTQDPLNKVASHGRKVRNLVLMQRSTPHSRANQNPRFSVFGGVQIFIDLERAFDSVNRTTLFSKLDQVGVTLDIVQLLRCWHVDTTYHIHHAGVSAQIPVHKGLRQGCKGAPFLWNSLMTLMLQELQKHLSPSWIREHLSIYADDCHIGGTFCNHDEFHALLHAIGVFSRSCKNLT